MIALSEDAYLMLRAISAAAEPIDMFEAAEAIQGEPASLDGRTREHKAFIARRIELVKAFVELWKAGLIREVSEDGNGSTSVVTDAGRAALATYRKEAPRSLLIRNAGTTTAATAAPTPTKGGDGDCGPMG